MKLNRLMRKLFTFMRRVSFLEEYRETLELQKSSNKTLMHFVEQR